MSELIPFHGVNLATGGRPDIRAAIKHYTAPYSAVEPFVDLIEVVRKNSTRDRLSRDQAPSAAIEIRRAVAGRLDAVSDARDRLTVVLLRPDEENVRDLIGAMLMAFPTPPTSTSGFYIDTLVLELQEPQAGEPYSLPAIAAAAREMWQTLASPPSIAEFLTCIRKHNKKLDAVFQQLCDILEAADWADDLVQPGETPSVRDDDF